MRCATFGSDLLQLRLPKQSRAVNSYCYQFTKQTVICCCKKITQKQIFFLTVAYGLTMIKLYFPLSAIIGIVSLAVRSTLDLRPIGLSVTTSMGRNIFFFAESPHATAAEKKNISCAINRRAPCPPKLRTFTRNTRKNAKISHSRISRKGK